MAINIQQSTIVYIPLDRIVDKLPVRRLSTVGIKRIRKNIRQSGFLDNYPLVVSLLGNGRYRLIEGNHRYEAAKEEGLSFVPCIVKEGLSESEQYKLAFQSNSAAETMVPSTMVHYAEFVWKCSDEEKTQEEIAKMIGWERGKVAKYAMLRNIKPCVWDIIVPTFELDGTINDNEVGTQIVPFGTIFTENLLRDIFDLELEQQLELVQALAHPNKDKRITKNAFTTRAKNYKTRNDAKKYAKDTLGNVDDDLLSELDKDIDKGWYDDDWKDSSEHPKLNVRIESVRKGWERRHSIQLIHGDFYTEVVSVGNESVDLILTDPPYNVASTREFVMAGRSNISQDFGEWDKYDHQEFINLFEIWGKEWFRILRSTGSGYVFTTDIYISYLRGALKRAGLCVKSALAWHKSNPPPQFSKTTYRSTVEYILFFTKTESGYTFNWLGDKEEMHNFISSGVCAGNERLINEKGETLHPTQKPEKILRHFIEVSSCIDDMVFDGFAGVGSSGKAAKDLGRKFIGIEQDKTFFDAMQRRLTDD